MLSTGHLLLRWILIQGLEEMKTDQMDFLSLVVNAILKFSNVKSVYDVNLLHFKARDC